MSNLSSALFPRFAFVLIFVLSPFTASAQVLYGSLTGNVTDPSGAAVPSAKVDATNLATGGSRQATTDDHGGYVISDMQAGTYKVTFSAPSLAGVVESGVPIAPNTVRRVDVQLQLASTGQSVNIAADATGLQTDRADVNTQVTTQEIADLPLTGTNGTRNFESIFQTIPGFSPPAASHSIASNPTMAQAFNVNGSTYTGNNIKLDGASDIFPWLPEIAAYIPPSEAIETVSVVTNSFDAEQGFAAGSNINVIIKSGTNKFHGAAWEYNTDSALKARNFFYYGPTNPKNILNQFGLNTGGPIKKNKLFFFADWERTMQRQLVSVFQTVPTDPLRQGNFSGIGTLIYDPSTGTPTGTGRTPFPNNIIPASSISPAAAKMIALIPEPNVPGAGISNNYFATGDTIYNRDNIDVKINYSPNDKSSVFGRYSIMPSSLFDPQALRAAGGQAIDGGQPGNSTARVQSASIGATYSLTPNLLLDGSIAFTRIHDLSANTDIGQNYGLTVLGIPGTNGPSGLNGGYPSFNVSNYSAIGNSNASNPQEVRNNLFDEAVNLGWVKGSHNLRFGAEFFHYSIVNFGANTIVGVRGGFFFTGGVTALNGGPAPNLYNSFADFLLGLPTR